MVRKKLFSHPQAFWRSSPNQVCGEVLPFNCSWPQLTCNVIFVVLLLDHPMAVFDTGLLMAPVSSEAHARCIQINLDRAQPRHIQAQAGAFKLHSRPVHSPGAFTVHFGCRILGAFWMCLRLTAAVTQLQLTCNVPFVMLLLAHPMVAFDTGLLHIACSQCALSMCCYPSSSFRGDLHATPSHSSLVAVQSKLSFPSGDQDRSLSSTPWVLELPKGWCQNP